MAQHLSIRIPWKDNGYDGIVCNKPCYNNACLRLKNIAENRNDEFEKKLAGCPMVGHEAELPCISEGGACMSAVSLTRSTVHPYKKNNPKSKSHGHFRETTLIYPPFSLPARPFGWTMLRKGNEQLGENIRRLAEMHNIEYDKNREPDLGFETNWVQEATNQRAIFKRFYANVKPRKSLVVPYAKQVPFIEDAKRVVMGIGFVDNIIEPPEHEHTDEGKLRSIFWETMIGHSIRDEREDGFMLPYREMMEYAENHPDFDIRSITVFAEDEYFNEFSYATEHLSYNAVICVLLQTIKALNIIRQCIPGNWDECISWANARLAEVWKDRGAFPGAGIMLYAMNFKSGIIIAEEIKTALSDNDCFITRLEKAISEPSEYLSPDTSASIGRSEQGAFLSLRGDRKELFWLLSRFALTPEQAKSIFNGGYEYYDFKKQKRYREVSLECADKDILDDPYIIFEKTRLLEPDIQVQFRTVDMAVFPPEEIRSIAPLPERTAVVADNDERRIRAIAVSILEEQALNGHTVYPQRKLIADINEMPLATYCSVTSDILNSLDAFFEPELIPIETKSGDIAYKLVRINNFDEEIRRAIRKRVGTATRHNVPEDWKKIVNDAFDKIKPISQISDPKERERERIARQEKTTILKELAEARLSILVGGAGTGKTTLLALLCKSSYIKNGEVLLLAPTGKARVRMGQAMKMQGISPKAKTVAQFLVQNDRYNGSIMRYQLSDREAPDVPDTVIVDECSMLTVDMFGALLQALKKAKRIILVGDPHQLPPIGAGRPFVDVVKHLKKDIPLIPPRVGKSYGELTITRRQQNENGSTRFDTILSECYSNTGKVLDSDIFSKLQSNDCGDNIKFKQYKSPDELEQLIIETLAEELGMNSVDDIDGFDFSLGGEPNGEWMNFGSKPEMIENWQILSPYRNDPKFGTTTINRFIHQRYRINTHALPKNKYRKASTKKMLGTDGIILGEKVINTRNQEIDGYPKEGCPNYVANGEVGIVERVWQKPKAKANTHQIRFSSQPNYSYNWRSSVSEEGTSDLELAYALTVHKAQGSEFGTVIMVISEPCRLLSKELLYTAITRQKDRLVILYNSEAYHLRKYSSMEFSDIARRFTDLFEEPEIVEYKNNFYEAKLIHKTARGTELVRSKSEVIIADALFDSGIDYAYEKELDLGEDGIKIPDFTIEDVERGTPFYWEHCGMITDENYRYRWEAKRPPRQNSCRFFKIH